ncbi:MAG: hypothetical protein HYS09_01130 [Chloroflexi bacterium]|nr:hypothetical protein [Chloroflexota bacterium]
MAEVFSGFITGYAVSLVFTGFAAVMVVGARTRVPYLAKAIAPNISAVMLAVPISIVAFLGWTVVGMVLGLVYRGALDHLPGAGLGSPNWPYTLGVLLFGLAVLAVVYYAWQRLGWELLLLTSLFVGAFGWGMPYMAKAAL